MRPGEERRFTLLRYGSAYNGMTDSWVKTYFLRDKVIAIRIDGTATVEIEGKVMGTVDLILPPISKTSIIPLSMVVEEMRVKVPSYGGGNVGVFLLGV